MSAPHAHTLEEGSLEGTCIILAGKAETPLLLVLTPWLYCFELEGKGKGCAQRQSQYHQLTSQALKVSQLTQLLQLGSEKKYHQQLFRQQQGSLFYTNFHLSPSTT